MTHGFSSTDKSKKPMNMFYDFSTDKTYAYDSNDELQEVNIGGGGDMPLLDFANPLYDFQTSTQFTASKECYLFGNIQGNITISVNNTEVLKTFYVSDVISGINVDIKLIAGDVVKTNVLIGANDGRLKVYQAR